MEKLKGLIETAKTGDETAMLQIIEKFQPIIRKYTRAANYSEDMHSDMILALIELIYAIDLCSLNYTSDYALINYVSKSLYHAYIRIAKENSSTSQYETQVDDESFIEQIQHDPSALNFIGDISIEDFLSSVLTPRERFCIVALLIQGDTATNVAARLGITRQAVNQCKRRAIAKLKKAMEN